MTRRNFIFFLSFSLSLVAGASYAEASDDHLVVAGKGFTEQLLMSAITSDVLREHGYEVANQDNLQSTMLRKAQENGEVDIYWEYTGTSLAVYNHMETAGLSGEETIQAVREADGKIGLEWLGCSDVNNTWAVAVKNKRELTNQYQTISDLAEAYDQGDILRLAATTESAHRSDGLQGMERAYDFRVPRSEKVLMAVGLYATALKNEQVDAAMITSTDGRISAFDLRLLEDDKQFFPDYSMCPVVRAETLQEHPEVKDILENIADKLDNSVMRRLNELVDVDKRSISSVARQFIEESGL